jgi:glutamate dehydrogenase (NAD(P)+)
MPTDAEPSFHRITSGARLLGFVAIDSTIAGRARGGLRLAPDVAEDEIRAAAHAMTLKYGLLGLPQGVAKAGFVGDGVAPPAEKRRLLHEFAAAAAPLLQTGRYVPDPDLGTTASDIRDMMQTAGVTVRARDWRANRSGEYTARSVLATALALLERRGASLVGTRVAIEGFGKVGASLAELLVARGAAVVAISTSRGALHRAEGLDVARLARRAREVGSHVVDGEPDRIERAALLELPVDVLFPCARFHSIHAGNVDRIAAAAICAGANDPVSAEAEAALLARGVAYPPDFVSNCGGVLGGTLEFAGVPFDRIGALVEERIHARARALLTRAAEQGVPARALAASEALARHAAVRARADHPDLLQRLVALGIEGYRRGWIPEKLVAVLAPRYIARGIG